MSEYTVERLGYQGDGIVAGPLFVSGVLPGETITGEVQGDRILNPSIVTPSADRVKAPCRHAKACGGCNLQHASDDFVSGFKAGVVVQALEARGIQQKPEAVVTSPPQSRRRAVFSARRTKKGALAGFHRKGSDTVIEVPDCQLLRPSLLSVVPALEKLTIAGASRKGEIRFTVTETLAGADVLAEGGKLAEGAFLAELARIAGAAGLARLTWEDELILMKEPPAVSFGDTRVNLPPGAFLQATREGQEALIAAVAETVSRASAVVDLFSGCGTFSLPAAKTSEVHAFEGERSMTEALLHGWRNGQGLKAVNAEARDLFRRPLMPDELSRFDAAIIDPPRAGAEAQIRELAASSVPLIAMVSCNPVTFARDAQTLVAAGFEMRRLTVVDQFRWSGHVEIFAAFYR